MKTKKIFTSSFKTLLNKKAELAAGTTYFIKTQETLDTLQAAAIQYGLDSNWNNEIGLNANNNLTTTDTTADNLFVKKQAIKSMAARGQGTIAYEPLERTPVTGYNGNVIGYTVKINLEKLEAMENMYEDLDASSVTSENIDMFFEDYDIFIDAGGQFRIDAAKKNYKVSAKYMFRGIDSGLGKKIHILLPNDYMKLSGEAKKDYTKLEKGHVYYTTDIFEFESDQEIDPNYKFAVKGPMMAARQQKASLLIEKTNYALEFAGSHADMSKEEYKILSQFVQGKTHEQIEMTKFIYRTYKNVWRTLIAIETMAKDEFVEHAKASNRYFTDEDIEDIAKSVTEKGLVNTAIASMMRMVYLEKGISPTFAGGLMLQLLKGKLDGDNGVVTDSRFLTSAFSEEFQLISAFLMQANGEDHLVAKGFHSKIRHVPGEVLPETIISDGDMIIAEDGTVLSSTLEQSLDKGIKLELKKTKKGTQYYMISLKEGLEHRIITSEKDKLVLKVKLESSTEVVKEFGTEGKAIAIKFNKDLDEEINAINDAIDVSKENRYFLFSDQKDMFVASQNSDGEWNHVFNVGSTKLLQEALNKKEVSQIRMYTGAQGKNAESYVFMTLTGEETEENITASMFSGKSLVEEDVTREELAPVDADKLLALMSKKSATKGVRKAFVAPKKEEAASKEETTEPKEETVESEVETVEPKTETTESEVKTEAPSELKPKARIRRRSTSNAGAANLDALFGMLAEDQESKEEEANRVLAELQAQLHDEDADEELE